MRQNGLPLGKSTGLTGYFSQVTHPRQIELLGMVTVDIIRQDRRVTRPALCLKLVGLIDATDDEDEAAHITALVKILFNR